jgi:hypothetical protein
MDHLSYCKRHTLVSNQPPPFQNVTTSIIIDQFSKRTFCLSLLLLSISSPSFRVLGSGLWGLGRPGAAVECGGGWGVSASTPLCRLCNKSFSTVDREYAGYRPGVCCAYCALFGSSTVRTLWSATCCAGLLYEIRYVGILSL